MQCSRLRSTVLQLLSLSSSTFRKLDIVKSTRCATNLYTRNNNLNETDKKPALPSNPAKIIRLYSSKQNISIEPLASCALGQQLHVFKKYKYIYCFLPHFLKDLDVQVAQSFHPSTTSLPFHKSRSKFFYQKEGRHINLYWLPNSPSSYSWLSSSRSYAFIVALIVGSAVFSYSSWHFFLDKSDRLLSLFIEPVHASTDFERNNFIADVVEKAGPAVVFLEIKGRHPLTGRPVTLSNGSGFIVRSNGIILTNAHVVANKSSVSVKLQDGRVFEGQVTAVDPISDLAAVKISASGLPTIPLGNSSDIRPGEWVIAMGSPLSLSNTVTCGIVSSVQRASKELGLRNKNMDYIQTDAVINFGNSGGPLVNLDGKAIGINTMKVTTGISFAIPSDYAVKFLVKAEALMKNGKTENGFLKRRYMGITMLTLTEGVMRDLKNNIKMPNFSEVKGGVFVYKVIPGSPAHLGGILAGDIIIEISGVAIRSAADVYDAVEKADHLKVTVIRGSDKRVISINTQETI